MAKTTEQLLQQAVQIRDEQANKKNTALRVGTLFSDIIEKQEESDQTHATDVTKINEAVTENREKVTNLNKNTGISGYPVWKPNTAYAKGAVILNPDGQLVKNTVEQLDSGGTYNPVLWETTSLDKENREKVAELEFNDGIILQTDNIEISSNKDLSVSINITGEVWLFKKSGKYIVLPKTEQSLTINDSYSLFYDIPTRTYIVGSQQDYHNDRVFLGLNRDGVFYYGLFAPIQNKLINDKKIGDIETQISAILNNPIPNSILLGKAYNTSGNLQDFETLDCTPLLEVPYGSSYVNINQGPLYQVACFDSTKKYIGTATNTKFRNGKILDGSRFVSLSFLKSENIDYKNLSVSFNVVDDYKLTSKLGFKAGIMYKKAYNAFNGNLQDFETLDCTFPLSVPDTLSNVKVSVNQKFYGIACFDKDNSFLGQVKTNALIENTKYFSVSFLIEDTIDYNSLIISVENITDIDTTVIPTSRKGKKYYLFGDSITYWDSIISWYDPEVYMIGYPSYIRDVLGADIVNKGVPGNTAKQITDRLIKTNLSDAYAVTYMAGANDHAQSVPIGTIGDEDTNTYIGNLEIAAKYVLSNYPNVKMYFLSPLWTHRDGYVEYANAMEEVAKHYHIPILRWDLTSGLGEITADTFYVHEESNRVHPNNDGYKRLADSLIPFLQMY